MSVVALWEYTTKRGSDGGKGTPHQRITGAVANKAKKIESGYFEG